VAATADHIRARKRLKKQLFLSFDEWNVWYQNPVDQEIMQQRPWQVAPPLYEAPYTHEDALVAGLMLITLLRNAGRVRIACMAQLVNTIAPITTVPGGGVWRQSIYYPFMHAAIYGRGTVLDLRVKSPTYPNQQYGDVPLLDAVAVLNEEREDLTIFAVNRGQDGALPLEGDLRGVGSYRVIEHLVLEHANPVARNTLEQPGEVVPHNGGDARLEEGRLTATLPRLSWNIVRMARK
jgi:alpha-N-arabinofuranosidase